MMFLVYQYNHIKVRKHLFSTDTNKNSILNIILADDTPTSTDNNYHQRQKNDTHMYRSSSSQYQGQSPFNNYQGRTFFNRNRSGIIEQLILIRSDCVARIVGKVLLFCIFNKYMI